MLDRNTSAANSPLAYGSVARILHWLTALLIIITFPLGLIANGLPYDSSEALALKAQVFSVHKTLGVLVFFTALIRILWALANPRPAPLHPARRVETFLAELVHWALYASLVVVPLSGWIHHAATTGFAPILWPFGQDLPLVPKSEAVASVAGAAHWIFTKVLLVSLILHLVGVAKHVLIDRDLTLARMTKGTEAGSPSGKPGHLAPALTAAAIFLVAMGGAWNMAGGERAEAAAATAETAPATDENTPDAAFPWEVTEGTLGFAVQQMGASVQGQLPVWTASIDFDDQSGTGNVTVEIDTTTLTLGSVTDQAKGAEFFDTTAHPNARFIAEISPAAQGYEAKGTLNLRGVSVPVTLPFQLEIDGETARMSGQVTLDRRDFGMGESYKDEQTVGFSVEVSIALTAKRGG